MFERSGFNNVPKFLTALKKGIDGGLDDLGEAALDVIDKEFEQERTAQGEPWAPLKFETVQKTGPDTLQDDGDLRDSFEYDVSRLKGELKVYTEDPKASYHEFGVPDQNIPRRPFLEPAAEYTASEGFTEEFKPAVYDRTDDALKTGIR